MMRTRAAASADSAGAPAPGALTVQVSAQSDNFSPRTGRQSAEVATNLIEVGTPRAPGRRQRASRHRAPRYPCGRRDRATLPSDGGARAGAVSARRGRQSWPNSSGTWLERHLTCSCAQKLLRAFQRSDMTIHVALINVVHAFEEQRLRCPENRPTRCHMVHLGYCIVDVQIDVNKGVCSGRESSYVRP